MTILETKNVTKRFDGVHAVDRLSIAVEKGRITGIIGPNGSGKTTLLNLLSGMQAMDGGEVIINGVKNCTQILPYHIYFYGMTRTFQNIRLFEQMTVLDNIMVVITERNVFSSLCETHTAYHLKNAEEVLRAIGLWDKRDQLAAHLSYGQRKLLEIARTLAMQSEIYLFDEPFAGLFPEMRKIVSGIIRKLKWEGHTIILIEHDMSVIRELCDYIFVMDGGKLLAQGKPEQVLQTREVIEAYLGE